MAGFEPHINGISFPADSHHSPCGEEFVHSHEVVVHERHCADCKAFMAILHPDRSATAVEAIRHQYRV